MPEMPYIVAAYGVAWVVFIGFAAYLVSRGRRAERAAQSRAGE